MGNVKSIAVKVDADEIHAVLEEEARRQSRKLGERVGLAEIVRKALLREARRLDAKHRSVNRHG